MLAHFVPFVNLDADQVHFRAEPIQPPNAAHARAAFLICLCNAALRAQALPERMPLRRDAGHELVPDLSSPESDESDDASSPQSLPVYGSESPTYIPHRWH